MFPSRVPLTRDTGAGTSRVCQRCEQPGHAIYECKNPRPYKTRPTRAQVLEDPKLASKWRPTASHEQVSVRQRGIADDVIAYREHERRRRSPSVSSQDSDASHPASCSTCTRSRSPSPHPSSCSTCTPVSQRNDDNSETEEDESFSRVRNKSRSPVQMSRAYNISRSP